MDADAHVGGAHRARAEAGSRPAGQLADGLGHERGATLMARGDHLDARLRQRIEQAQKTLAGHRECPLDAGLSQSAGKHVREGRRQSAAWCSAQR